MNRFLLPLVLCATCVPATAEPFSHQLVAAQNAVSSLPPFATLDRNGDGFITRAEAVAADAPVERLLDQADMDGDGQLSRVEYQALLDAEAAMQTGKPQAGGAGRY